METNQTLLQKYFPKTFEDLILPTETKQELSKNKEKQGYRLLLFSSPGTGKTTTSRLITLGNDYDNMYLSGSNDFKIELFRQKVVPFVTNHSVLGKQKNLIIDEADRISSIIQDAFKVLIDKAINTNFIFITNNIDDIIDPLQSRFTKIDYDFTGTKLEEHKKSFINFTLKVCKESNIPFDAKGIKTLFNLNFPDFRHLLVNLQQIKDINGSVSETQILSLTESGKQLTELYQIIENPAIYGKDLYTEITKYKGKEKECLLSLGEPFFKYLNDKNQYDKTLEVVEIISKYCSQYNESINKYLTFFTCIVELKKLFK